MKDCELDNMSMPKRRLRNALCTSVDITFGYCEEKFPKTFSVAVDKTFTVLAFFVIAGFAASLPITTLWAMGTHQFQRFRRGGWHEKPHRLPPHQSTPSVRCIEPPKICPR